MKQKISLNTIQDHETILIYGKPKIGKSFSYCSVVDRCVNAGHKVFLINTDNGVKRTMMEYFGNKFEEITKSIEYYLITEINDIEEVIKDIKKNVTINDLVIIDLLSDFWEMAQQKFVENLSGGNIVDYYERASRDKAKFGLLSGDKWQYIKKLDNMIISELVIKPPCKIIAVAGAKQLEMDRIHANKQDSSKEIIDRYDLVGEKPEGQRQLQYKFNSIVYIGEVNKQKYFVVLGDRGRFVDYERINFKRDFWSAFQQYRKNEVEK